MKIGVDIRTACEPKSGKGWYTHHLVKHLLGLDRKNEYLLYTNRLTADVADFKNASIKIIAKHPLLWHFAVIRDFLKQNGDLFFAPTSYVIPAFLPKTVMTAHDLIAFAYPEEHQWKATMMERMLLPYALKNCRQVIVPSASTRRDLLRFFPGFPENRLIVTALAADERFGAEIDQETLQRAAKNYRLPQKFILTVGSLVPRKNIGRLVNAMTGTAENLRTMLVVVGTQRWQYEALLKKMAAHKNTVLHIKDCPPEDLPAIYRLATVFVFPSLYEGFGLPPLEAMASGCPVVCSNRSSLPEVVGDAALLVDPENTNDIADAIARLLGDEKLRAEMREKGLRQAQKFSWRKTAEETLKIFEAA